MKRKVAMAMVAAMAVSSFTVPVFAEDAAAEGGKIGISMPTQSLERWNRDGLICRSSLRTLDMKLSLPTLTMRQIVR